MNQFSTPLLSTPLLAPKVYTLDEAAQLLKVHPITIRRLINRKLLRRLQYIRDIRIPTEDVDRLVANQAVDHPKRTRSNRQI